LVEGDGAALLVDTLFDLRLTAEMLVTMRRALRGADHIGTVVNTHANGDHCFGNALVADAEIVASRACALEMERLPPSRLADMMRAAPDLGAVGAFLQRIFGPFDFEGIELVAPTRTFDGELELRVGDRVVRLIEVGPAHTEGDVVVHLPSEGVVFTGDILFNGGHPIVWVGPVANWIAACDRILALGPTTVVPGHGPVTGPSRVADLKGYFEYLTTEAKARYEAGMPAADAVRDIDLGPYAGWTEAERMAVNVRTLYHDFGAGEVVDAATAMAAMAELAG
jgi:glyoxylase-like metal-dependent hydrolase (beta-lactamase superfamily II)